MPAVAANLAAIRARIDSALERSGRPAGSVVLLGASKRQSDERIRAAVAAGLADLGENQVQEAERHRPLAPNARWHLIGPLQSNKVRRAVALFDAVHSVDRLKIARALDREAERSGRALPGMLEINLGGEATKHGFPPDEVLAAASALAELTHLRLEGLMAIPPPARTAEEARGWFRALRELRDELFALEAWSDRPGYLSMGMSHDLESAIEEGATHVRVGSALFGPREPKAAR